MKRRCSGISSIVRTGIASAQPGTKPDIIIAAGRGRITAPTEAVPGWSRVRVDEDGAGHIVVLFRLPVTASDSTVADFLARLDTGVPTPLPGVALGGPEVGDTGQVIVHLTAGRYVIACMRAGADGQRHLHAGETAMLTVRGKAKKARAAAPHASQVVRMVDFAFVGDDQWKAGPQLIRVENNGHQDHQLRIVRLRDGASMSDWINAPNPGAFAVPVVGLARTGAGEVAFLPVNLAPGSYVAHCLVTDQTSGRQHIALGMYRLIEVR